MPQKKPVEASQTRTPDAPEPTHDEIARLAYELWEARGSAHGRDQEDWLEAEQLLAPQKAQSNAA